MKAKIIENKIYSTAEACARPYLPLKLFGLNNPIQCTLCNWLGIRNLQGTCSDCLGYTSADTLVFAMFACLVQDWVQAGMNFYMVKYYYVVRRCYCLLTQKEYSERVKGLS